MPLFNFFKKPKPSKEIVGRHQELCRINLMLGENVVDLELKQAKSRDLEERGLFLYKLSKVETDIESANLSSPFDLTKVYTDFSKLLDEGYETCVLQNDRDLEVKCLNIFGDIFSLIKRVLNDNSGTTLEELIDLRATKGLLMWQKLGDLLKTSEQEQCWFISSSIHYPNQRIGRWSEGSLIKLFLPILSEDDLKIMVDCIRKTKAVLLEQEAITHSQASFVEDELAEARRINLKANEKKQI